MIVIKIFNKCEIEQDSVASVSAEQKLFRIKYFSKMVNLLYKDMNKLTVDFISDLVKPDFRCASFDYNHSVDCLTVYFDRNVEDKQETSKVNIKTELQVDTSNETKEETTEDKNIESKDDTQLKQETITTDTTVTSDNTPKKRMKKEKSDENKTDCTK